MSDNDFAVSLDDIRSAADRIEGRVLRTPAIHSETLSRELGCETFFKAENVQHGGAFKARGATNAVFSLDDEQAAKGVVTHSSGNHAIALARAASLRGIPAYVVMPRDAPPPKIARVRSFGIEPVFCEPTVPAREATAEQVRTETGATMIHPYDNVHVMAGQGTVGLELLEQISSLQAVLVPIGGGGLLAGTLIALKSLAPDVKVIAVEPELADDAARSLEAGERQMPVRYDTVADGLRTSVGELTFPIIHHWLDDIVLVSESEILSATRRLAEDVHLVAEPSGAVTLAGLMKLAPNLQGQTVAAVVSGGNLSFGECRLGDRPKGA